MNPYVVIVIQCMVALMFLGWVLTLKAYIAGLKAKNNNLEGALKAEVRARHEGSPIYSH